MLYVYTLTLFTSISYGLKIDEGWNYINLHCRNNENEPVDWWYLLKPPGDAAPYDDSGRNFTFIISNIIDRWIMTSQWITSENMLLHTLAPAYRKTYTNQLSYLVYDDGGTQDSAKARGVMLAGELGGIFISHTVPNLVDTKHRPRFPKKELNNGHLIVCMTMDIESLNELAVLLRKAGIRITASHVPKTMEGIVPTWTNGKTKLDKHINPDVLQYAWTAGALNGIVLFRWPGKNVCLYEEFAKKREIVLDVYSTNHRPKTNICRKDYSVRSIDLISLKIPDQKVHYCNNRTDMTRFAVSTMAQWQQKGSARAAQPWTCTSTLDVADDSGRGGFVLCIDDERVWHAFDNLKTKEPECNMNVPDF